MDGHCNSVWYNMYVDNKLFRKERKKMKVARTKTKAMLIAHMIEGTNQSVKNPLHAEAQLKTLNTWCTLSTKRLAAKVKLPEL